MALCTAAKICPACQNITRRRMLFRMRGVALWLLFESSCEILPCQASVLDCLQGKKLAALEGLSEALAIMESYILHSVHLDAMLLYRSLQPLSSILGEWKLRHRSCIAPPPPPEPSGA